MNSVLRGDTPPTTGFLGFRLKAIGGLVRWIGFDRFIGLPRGWRDLEPGAFDAGGRPPALSDTRLEFVVGDVEETLPLVQIGIETNVLLFDLDLHEPTLFCFRYFFPRLKKGDLLYFDEAFDTDERQIIENYFIPEFNLELIGYTHTACAFMIDSRM